MIWLQSNDKYDELAQYDHASGAYKNASRKAMTASLNTDGTFSILAGTFVALYNFEQLLFLRIGDECICLSEDVVATVSGGINNRSLTVKKSKSEILHLDYSLDHSPQFSNDPTPFIEDEDFDFGLFVSNISKSEERKRVLLGLD